MEAWKLPGIDGEIGDFWRAEACVKMSSGGAVGGGHRGNTRAHRLLPRRLPHVSPRTQIVAWPRSPGRGDALCRGGTFSVLSHHIDSPMPGASRGSRYNPPPAPSSSRKGRGSVVISTLISLMIEGELWMPAVGGWRPSQAGGGGDPKPPGGL